MNTKRRILFAALLTTCTTAPVNAGCLDWLCCSTPTPAYPYAAGYAPATTIVPVGPPTLTGTSVSPYSAGYAPYAAGYAPYVAGYAPYTAGSLPYAAGYAGVQSNVAAQAPAYGAAVPSYGVAIPAVAPVTAYSLPLDNPSVLTGRPVMQTSYYGSAVLPPAATTPTPQPPTSWFGRMLGNNYQTSYYAVPTTTFRPITQVDPATGALVTVQQPCTSLTQQVQRTPYTSLQPAAAPVMPYYGEPTCGGEPPRYSVPTSYGPPANYAPQSGYPQVGTYTGPSGVAQATATAPINGTQANGATGYGAPNVGSPGYSSPGYPAPVPGTGNFPYGQQPYDATAAPLSQPNLQPLTGTPGGSTGDNSVIPVPQLDSYRPAWSSPSQSISSPPNATPSMPPAAYPSTAVPSTSYPATSSGLVAPPLPATSSWPDRREVRANETLTTTQSFAGQTERKKYDDVAPIPAADNYRAPSWSELYSKPNATPVDSGRDRGSKPFPSSASLSEPRTASSDRPSSDGSLRYASAPSNLPSLPAPTAPQAEPRRDDSGWVAIEPR